ncbi:hypothetical protein [Streptomyces sp. LN549]|uniref:hypothetical protein n=1 Tax=Streptomyces sp. LN549 TaxID=3112979 RepID=UPI00371B21DE
MTSPAHLRQAGAPLHVGIPHHDRPRNGSDGHSQRRPGAGVAQGVALFIAAAAVLLITAAGFRLRPVARV